MKRANYLIPQIADIDNLRYAFWKARKGKDGKQEVEVFRKNLDANLLILRKQILTENVVVGDYSYFKIYDPKERVISAAAFPERVLQHAIMNVCDKVFEDFQIFDSYATRRGKGTYAALNRAEYFQDKHRWFLKLDIRKYFDNIDHGVLIALLVKRFKEPVLWGILTQIIESYQVDKGKGVPIGNLTSQYFANFYLAFTDRYIKQELGIKAYVRYMDDMVLWSNDKQKLKDAAGLIETFLIDTLLLKLKIKLLNRTSHGLSFVGYRIFKGITKLNNRSKNRFKRKIKTYFYKLETEEWSEEDFQRHLLPLIAFTKHACAKGFRQNVLEKIG